MIASGARRVVRRTSLVIPPLTLITGNPYSAASSSAIIVAPFPEVIPDPISLNRLSRTAMPSRKPRRRGDAPELIPSVLAIRVPVACATFSLFAVIVRATLLWGTTGGYSLRRRDGGSPRGSCGRVGSVSGVSARRQRHRRRLRPRTNSAVHVYAGFHFGTSGAWCPLSHKVRRQHLACFRSHRQPPSVLPFNTLQKKKNDNRGEEKRQRKNKLLRLAP